MVRRMMLWTVALATVVTLGWSSAASAAPRLHVKVGHEWTIEVDNGGGCEILQFGAHHTWNDIDFPDDYGTYAGGGSSITLTWGDKTLSFHGDFFPSADEYIGLFPTSGDIGQLVVGAVSSWDGVSC